MIAPPNSSDALLNINVSFRPPQKLVSRLKHGAWRWKQGYIILAPCTIYIVDLEKEMQFVHLRAIGEQCEAIHELTQTDEATAIGIKQTEETLSKERLKREHPM